MDAMKLVMCAVSAVALDLCILVMIISAYREKKAGTKSWQHTTGNMELASQDMIFPLGCDEVLIGRHASADIRLPDLSVSRYHAMLTVSEGVWTITDIGSKSGVYVNGCLVMQSILRENDVISLGNKKLIFRRRRDQIVR